MPSVTVPPDAATSNGMAASVSTSCGGAAEKLLDVRPRAGPAAEELAEDVGRLRRHALLEAEAAGGAAAPAERTAAGTASVHAGGAELVVAGALGLVAQDVVGLLHLLEARLGLLVAGVAVGVVLTGQLAVGLLDLVGRGGARDAEDLVIIARHGHSPQEGHHEIHEKHEKKRRQEEGKDKH